MFQIHFRSNISSFGGLKTRWKDENPAVLQKIGIDDIIQINSAYSWSPAEKDELKWKTIPRTTAIKVYQKYFADFVIFGYSTEDVIPFINASDPDLGKNIWHLPKWPHIVWRVIQEFASVLSRPGKPAELT